MQTYVRYKIVDLKRLSRKTCDPQPTLVFFCLSAGIQYDN